MGAGPGFTPPGQHLVDTNAGLVTEWGQVGASPWQVGEHYGTGRRPQVFCLGRETRVERERGLGKMESRRGPERAQEGGVRAVGPEQWD